MLLPLSICGRKMSISRLNCLGMPFYSKLMFPIERLLADFRWQSIGFADALNRPVFFGAAEADYFSTMIFGALLFS